MPLKNGYKILFRKAYHPNKSNFYGNFYHEFLPKHSLPSITI